MSEKTLLETSHLSKYFDLGVSGHSRKILKAVDDVSFTLKEGETLGLVGESGCGKSTLGRTLLNLDSPTSGEIRYEGTVLTKDNIATYSRKMQMIFQDPYSSLNPRMTVRDIIAEPLEVYNLYPSKKERMDRIYELMDTVGLRHDYLLRYPHEFSGGQRQRIVIARALAAEPKFIVCDEPVSALDVSVKAQVINMFGDIQKSLGISYLFITHDLLTARYISHRIAVMYLGRVVEIADSDELHKNPLHPYTQSLLSAVPIPNPDLAAKKKRIALQGEIPSPLRAPSGCSFRTRCPYATEKCAENIPQLTEVTSGHFTTCNRTSL